MEFKPIVLPLTTVRNPRDLGSYIGADGRKIKTHRLIRSGRISNISIEDQQFLRNYGLVKIIDLRSPLECKTSTDTEIPGVTHYNYPLAQVDNTNGGQHDITKTFAHYRQDQYAGFKMMCDRYRSHVINKHAQHTLKKVIETLINTPDGTVMYHCSEGKDRTGIVTLMVLYLLGVDLETIRRDYLFSNYLLNDYRAIRDQKFKQAGENLKFRANMRILGSVTDAFFDTSLISIQEEFGGLDNYLKQQLGITPDLIEALRQLYLEKK